MSSRMRPEDREEWILSALADHHGTVNVLNADFVNAYIDATGAKFSGAMWGADKCPQLGSDLSRMFRRKVLKRYACGLSSGAWQPGFPKWVWAYSESPWHKQMRADIAAEKAFRSIEADKVSMGAKT